MGQSVLPPGFRFHPTDEELVVHYLRKKVSGGKSQDRFIGEVDLYKFEPWDLPEKSVLRSRDPEWYFFNARDQKYPRGSRTNRATDAGYWKATGKDRKVCSGGRTVGMKKTLVFYLGRAPNGGRTDWIMHEYRLEEEIEEKHKHSFVLCRIHKKSGPGPRNGEQYGAPVLDEDDEIVSPTMTEAANEKLCVGISPQISKDGDFVKIEEMNDGEDLEALLESILPYESQDTVFGETPINLDLTSMQGLSEVGTVSADNFHLLAENCAVNQGEDIFSFDPDHVSTMETPQQVPDLSNLGVNDLDNLHAILHPVHDEAEMLGDLFQTLVPGRVETVSSLDYILNQTEGMPLEARTHSVDLASGDYFELADLEFTLDEHMSTLPALEPGGFKTQEELEASIHEEDTGIVTGNRSRLTYNEDLMSADFFELADWEYPLDLTLPALEAGGFEIQEELESSIYEEDNGIVPRNHTGLAQGSLHGHGTAPSRVRLQTSPFHLPPEEIGGTVVFGKTFLNLEAQFPSSEVLMLTSGDLKEVSIREFQNAEILRKGHNGDNSLPDISSGFGRASSSQPSKTQFTKTYKKSNDTSFQEQTCLCLVPQYEPVPSRPEQVALTDLLLDDGDSTTLMANSSDVLSMDVCNHGVPAGMVLSGLNASFEDVCCAENTNSEGALACVQQLGVDLDTIGLPYPSPDIYMESLLLGRSSNFGSGSVSVANAGQMDSRDSIEPIRTDYISLMALRQDIETETVSLPGQDFSNLANTRGHLVLPDQRGDSIAAPIQFSLSASSNINSGLESSQSSSARPTFLERILESLGKVSVLPASAAELPLDLQQVKFVIKKPSSSKFISTSAPKTCTVQTPINLSMSCSSKAEVEHSQATSPGKCFLKGASPHLIHSSKADLSVSGEFLGLAQIEHGSCSNATSRYKLSKLSMWIIAEDRRKMCKSLGSSLTSFLFWGVTVGLIFFCPLQAFWCRLTRSALTIIY